MTPNLLMPLLLVSLIIQPTPLQADARRGFPKELIGKWQVVGVRLDSTFTARTYYEYDDKSLLGKTVTIQRTEARGNLPETLWCIGPNITEQRSTLDGLLAKTMARQEELEQSAASKRYMLAADGGASVTVYWVGCGKGDFGPDVPFGPGGENWIALLPGGNAATRWYDNTILLLKRKR
ncbi:hypothetical protein KP004_18855 [Geomonas oryzisoli]|uniref:Lipocalin-like domain-containing protein n=1 Tax=Geomonas oryzisoli TaxID=2847992 RepID=A0ABX8J5C1_9BACT|nr:hypothetical protein [Geomonas oryzisoli]QWV93201.1 hypothetical protein KP004_18855 [Geomonas oryzisoli]